MISIVTYADIDIGSNFVNLQPLYNNNPVGIAHGLSNSSTPFSNPIVFQFLQTATASSTLSLQVQTGPYDVISPGNCTITFVKLS